MGRARHDRCFSVVTTPSLVSYFFGEWDWNDAIRISPSSLQHLISALPFNLGVFAT
jgi:hypothetical protein